MNHIFHYDEPKVADPGDELSIQIAMRKALKQRAPHLAFVAIPNGAQRTAWASIKAKQEGLQPGFPDCQIMAPGGRMVFAEVKARNGALSEQQHIWLNWLTNAGFKAGCFRSVATLLQALEEWGFLTSQEAVA